ncbi:MAG: transcription termination/antitermination protein NusA [Synergistaceae bacterium]|nr:transcription termination/antitermination protein NusA [Synergistaceae bacterium]MBR0094559.1 transcription termination/antitermination protein NusA [Synergistaceae bacterium]
MRLGHEFIEALDALAEQRGLDITVVIATMESAMQSAYNKYQPGEAETEIKIDHDTGDMTIYELRTVVETLSDTPNTEITLKDALKYDPNAEIGEKIKIEKNPTNFGRIAAQTARQVITQKLRDAERNVVYNSFADRVGDMVSGTIYRVEGDDIVIRINDKTDAELPKRERINGERYNPGTVMRFYVLEVKQKQRGPRIVVSRTHPGLLKKLMELEIPEIADGIIEIKNIVRDGGSRAKVALATLDPNVDPVGACIGNGGIRVKALSSSLKGERIDAVVYSPDPLVYIKNALVPAQIVKVEPVLDHEKEATAYVYQDQLSLAIGKAGQNVKLAAKLTGWKINVTTVEPDRMPTLKDIFHEVFEDGQQE